MRHSVWKGLFSFQHRTSARAGRSVPLFLIGTLSVCVSTVAASHVYATTGAISQSYKTNDKNIAQGALLSLVSKSNGIVALANSGSNASTLVGVAASKSLVELSGGGSDGVQVVVSGSSDVLVSDLNGRIQAGDRISASPVSGIGMKATNPSEIVGIAQASLSSVKTITQNFVSADGRTISAKVGLLPVAINVTYYAGSPSGTISAYVPPFLQGMANAIAGKAVSPLRVLIGTLALLLGFATIAIMLYTGIRSGVISLGRNPLAADALRGSLVDILVAAGGVLVVTGTVVTAVVAM